MPWTNQENLRILTEEWALAYKEWRKDHSLPYPEPVYRALTDEEYLKRRRWVNDCPRRRFMQCSAWRALENYYFARSRGYSQKLSVKYSMLIHERSWHSGGGFDISSKQWKTNSRIDTSKQRFCFLLSNTFKRKITMRDLETWNVETALDYPEAVKPGLYNFWSICRDGVIPLGYTRNTVACHFAYLNPTGWANVTRGRDLFCLWPYNIPEAVNRLVSIRGLLPSVSDLTESVYGASTYELTRHERIIPYVKRWLPWFRQDNNMGRLDEIPENVDLAIRPEQALVVRESTIKKAPASTEPYQLLEKLKELKLGQYSLRPVRNQVELVEVSRGLHNCASSYHWSVQEGKCALVLAEDSKRQDKLVALGELVMHNGLPLKWGQIKGPCNAGVEPKLRSAYKSYLEKVR